MASTRGLRSSGSTHQVVEVEAILGISEGGDKDYQRLVESSFLTPLGFEGMGSWALGRTLLSKLESLLSQEESHGKQRSKVTWIWDGDRNTRHFHQKMSNRLRTMV